MDAAGFLGHVTAQNIPTRNATVSKPMRTRQKTTSNVLWIGCVSIARLMARGGVPVAAPPHTPEGREHRFPIR